MDLLDTGYMNALSESLALANTTVPWQRSNSPCTIAVNIAHSQTVYTRPSVQVWEHR